MKKTQFTEEQILGVLKQVEGGRRIADVCREQGISDATYHRWKAKYGGLEVSQLRRLKQLEEEHRKLKQLVGELTLDNAALKDGVAKKWRRPPRGARWWPTCRSGTTSRSGGRVEWPVRRAPRSVT